MVHKTTFFLQSSNAHAVFYMLVGPLTRRFDFDTVAVIGRIVSMGLLSFGWVLVSQRLLLSAIATVTAAALFCGIATTGKSVRRMGRRWIRKARFPRMVSL